MSKLRVEGHRGCMTSFTENSLDAFLDADRLGLDGIEFDTWLTKDGAAVIFHGKSDFGLETLYSLERNRLEPVFIPSLNAAELHKFRLERSNNKIPLFSDLMITLGHKQSKLALNIELKDYSYDLVEKISSQLDISPWKPKYQFSSFAHQTRAHLEKYAAKVGKKRSPFGYLSSNLSGNPKYEEIVQNFVEGDSFNLDIQFVLTDCQITKKLVSDLKKKGFGIKVYNLNVLEYLETPEIFEKIIAYGADTMILNRPERLLHYNEKK